MLSKKLLVSTLALCVSASAFAHFQLIHTETSDITGKSSVPFELVFTHPGEGVEGHSMDIGKDEKGTIVKPVAFYSVHKEEKMDLTDKLVSSKFGPNGHQVQAYKFTLDRTTGLKGGGDWGFVFVPSPYYEGAEDIYIQQVTKVFVNKDDLQTDWDARIAEGYPEIVPLNNPTNMWVGQVFRGRVVDGKGEAVANAEIEVEYINADIKNSQFLGANKSEKAAMVLRGDEEGYFSFVPVQAGYWGFAALGAGGELQLNGKELSQDAVLWIEAK